MSKKVKSGSQLKEYKTENVIDEYGRVVKQVLYLDGGQQKDYIFSTTTYDTQEGNYGNIIKIPGAYFEKLSNRNMKGFVFGEDAASR